jgi:hypothetical protein
MSETSIQKAEKVLNDLQAKREGCVRAGTELNDERANVALAAHTGDSKARKRLGREPINPPGGRLAESAMPR